MQLQKHHALKVKLDLSRVYVWYLVHRDRTSPRWGKPQANETNYELNV